MKFLLLLFAVAALAQQPCDVAGIDNILPSSGGFDVAGGVIVYTVPVNGVSQVFRLDANGNNCLTCVDIPNGPAANRHKGAPSFLPDGQHFVLQVEMAAHPFEGTLGDPGSGWFNNVWITDGASWTQLTDYPSGENDRFGVLLPAPSPDGSQLAWGWLYESDPLAQYLYQLDGTILPGGAPWGKWKLNIADLVSPGGSWRLRKVRSYAPRGGVFFEPQDWRGGSVLVATDAERPTPHAMDLLEFDGSASTWATSDPSAWIEFGAWSPNGMRLAYMSSCCGYTVDQPKSALRTELYLDGVRLTGFNDPAAPEYIPGGAVVTKVRWFADGIYFELPFFNVDGSPAGSWLKRLRFAGGCGL